MAEERSFRDIRVASSEIGIRKIAVKDLWECLKLGYDDFNATPSFGVFLIIIYPLFALLLTLFLLGENLPYLAFPIVAGFTLLGPMVSVAIMEKSRHRELGLDLSWRSAFDFVHSATFAPIVALSLFMMLLYVAWLFMAEFIYFGLFGTDPPGSISEFATELVTTSRGAGLVLHGTVVGFIFALTALGVSVFGFPLLLDRPASTLTAVSVSVRAVANNLYVMAVWGVIVVLLLAAGAILFLIGLALVLPVLGHATWHLYRKVVEP